MKRTLPLVLLVSVWSSCLNAQITSPVPLDSSKSAAVVEVGPHHRVWQKVSADEHGQTITNAYIELATGLNFLDPATGQYTESQSTFELTPNGYAVARRGQHQASLAPNINSGGSVDLLADGKRFLSNPMGLSFYDLSTGTNVLLAEVKDCIGQFIPPNVILYDDAFTDIKGALRYTYTKGGFEQDVLIYDSTGLGSPEDYGLNPSTTLLEMYSEFHESPTPQKTIQLTPDELSDESLSFGQVAIGNGKAFDLQEPERFIAMAKSWQNIGGRTFLVESLRYSAAQAFLDNLHAGVAKQSNVAQRMVADRRKLVALDGMRPKTRMKEVASIKPGKMNRKRGFIMDYLILNTSQTNYVFKGDTTYFIRDVVYLSGNTTFEAGTVFKFDPWAAGAPSLWVLGTIDCQATAYRPIVLTGKDDDTVGDLISGSTGNPTPAGYANYGIVVDNATNASTSWANLRFTYLQTAFQAARWASHTLSHSQIVNCGRAILVFAQADVSARNVLIDNATTAFEHGSGVARGEHLTIHRTTNLKIEPYGAKPLYVTNSLIVGVTNLPTSTNSFLSVSSYVSSNDVPSIFQTVGAGSHYLSDNTYRNSGTTNINSTLTSELKKLTTYPPIVLTNDFTVSTTLAPQAPRDTDIPDLGWHYSPLDYCWSSLNLSNSNLTLTNGVAVGIYGEYGTIMQSGGNFVSEGKVTDLNRLLHYQTVQEQPILWGSSFKRLFNFAWSTVTPKAQLRFTDLAALAGSPVARMIWNGGYNNATLSFKDCLFRGACLYIYSPATGTTATVGLTNNFADRAILNITQGYSGTAYPVYLDLRNNLFRNGSVTLTYYTTNNYVWSLRDNLFDGVALTVSSSSTNIAPVNSNNGYHNTTNLPATSGGDVTLAGVDYQPGPLGNYYYPTNGTNLFSLVNAGSRNADLAGLYHHTVRVDQLNETNSVVDIGFHFMAVDINGIPLDSDGDGIPDYLEDRNGNGGCDSTETDWQSSNSGMSGAAGLQVFTPLK